MFFILSKIIGVLLHPFFVIVLILLYSLWAKGTRRRNAIIASLVMIFFFGNQAITHTVVRWWEPAPPPAVVLERPYDVGIVLGGFSNLLIYHEDDLYDFSRRASRLTQGIELYAQGKIYRILISGGNAFITGDVPSEATKVKQFLMRAGVPEEDILLEEDSRTTYENALYSKALLEKELLDETRLLLLTSAMHLKRATACYQQVGLEVTPFPVDYVGEQILPNLESWLIPDHNCYEIWRALIHEWVGLLVYKLKGWS